MTKAKDAAALRLAPLDTPTDLRANAVAEISGALNILLADMFALYLKTKNFQRFATSTRTWPAPA